MTETRNSRRHSRLKKRKKRLRFRRLRFALILLALVFLVFGVRNLASTVVSVKTSYQQAQNAEKLDTLEEDVGNYIKNFKGQYGVYYYNLETGEEFGINDEDEYTYASTIKIPINLYLYDRIVSGSVDPDKTLTYLKEDDEGGTGTIRYQKFGAKYSIRELSEYSIEYSDNVAANMLIRHLGEQNIKDYMRQVGGQVVDNARDVSSPRDMGLYMRLVYNFYKSDETLGHELMDSFLNTEFNDRLPALLPPSVKVAHKIGTQLHVINDVGIVFADRPYVISVMSKDVNDEEAPDVIANVSKMVYESNL
jgi:beta-lactamase class A